MDIMSEIIISHGYNVKGRIAVRTGKTMTIVDIAKESGYSVTTVSRVLNNRQDVSPAAKETIMKIVEAHNFVPNNNAKRLKQTIYLSAGKGYLEYAVCKHSRGNPVDNRQNRLLFEHHISG